MDKGQTFNVLDHGYVKLVDFMGSDEAVVEAARMSTGRGFISWEPYQRCRECGALWREWKTDDGKEMLSLFPGETCKPCCDNPPKMNTEKFPNGDMGMLDRLWRKKHATPFECGGEIMIEVQAPIMVFREWHRHRTQSYNEFSARYAQMPDLHYLPNPERIQRQSSTNKQGSSGEVESEFRMQVIAELKDQQETVYESYDAWVDEGLAKEVARLNTPVSRYSKMRAKTDIRNWLAFLNLRMRPSAQWEIRQYAEAVSGILKALFPRTWSLFEEYDLYGANFSRTELDILQHLLSIHLDSDIVKLAVQRGLTGSKRDEFIEKLKKGGKEILA
jgi:thymidylate synthase (FAD)